MKKLLLLAVLATVLSTLVANAQVIVFPYFYDWTSPTAFAKQSDGRTYIGGDGNWYTYIVGTKPQWTTTTTTVHTNNNGTDDTLMVLVDATGLTFSGGETFAFVAKRGGGATGTMTMTAGANTIVKQVATDLSNSSNTSFSLSLPSNLGNSVFSVYIIVNSNKAVTVDSTSLFGGALPIQLASFGATAVNNSGVTLTWTTISEVNNYGFYVQRDGEDIGFVNGHGTTLQPHTYSYRDNLSAGQHNYRLKQVDLDRTTTFSESIIVNVNVPSEYALAQNYPNPSNPSTIIKYDLPEATYVSLTVYDILGREVSVLVNERKEAGVYEIKFDGSGLASGVYIYRLQAGNFVQTKRLVLLK